MGWGGGPALPSPTSWRRCHLDHELPPGSDVPRFPKSVLAGNETHPLCLWQGLSCALCLWSYQSRLHPHLSPPPRPPRSSQFKKRRDEGAHLRRGSLSGAPVKHEPLSRENSGKFWAAVLESRYPQQDPCPLTVFTACVPGTSKESPASRQFPQVLRPWSS